MSEEQSPPVILLYVENEIAIQEVVEAALREAGFDVVTATNGTDALNLLDSRASSFRALVTDINLGIGPDGWDIARRARELVEQIPVVYVSGASGHEWASKGVPQSVLIVKPFAPAQIITAVSSLLVTTDSHL